MKILCKEISTLFLYCLKVSFPMTKLILALTMLNTDKTCFNNSVDPDHCLLKSAN